eukprot:g52623.t1
MPLKASGLDFIGMVKTATANFPKRVLWNARGNNKGKPRHARFSKNDTFVARCEVVANMLSPQSENLRGPDPNQPHMVLAQYPLDVQMSEEKQKLRLYHFRVRGLFDRSVVAKSSAKVKRTQASSSSCSSTFVWVVFVSVPTAFEYWMSKNVDELGGLQAGPRETRHSQFGQLLGSLKEEYFTMPTLFTVEGAVQRRDSIAVPALVGGGSSLQHLTWLQVCTYGLGHVLNDMCASCWFFYLLVLLTQVRGMSGYKAGLVVLSGQ